ncbi:MAG: ribulokinase [Eubacteriaceae bacterium]|jgi:L-ribulokinase
MAKYTIGIDYGTLSGRAVLVNVQTGMEMGSSVYEYPHAVMEEQLPDGTRLPVDYALQYPQDYIDVLNTTVPDVLKKTRISPDDVIGVGIDFTACTVLPVDAEGIPLCFKPKYRSNPLSYVQLWKHHGAQHEADLITDVAEKRGENFLARYGGRASSESLFPRLLKILEDDPGLYADMDEYVEAGDWIVRLLTGEDTKNSCGAGYKALWSKKEGYPSTEFFKALNPAFENVVAEKIPSTIVAEGGKAGEINELGHQLTGLNIGTAVAAANIDAHSGVPGALKETAENQMLIIMGTSSCHMLISKEEKAVPGVFGVVEDGILPGFVGYEAGQSCVGDHFAWFVKNCVPASYEREAKDLGMNLHQFLTMKAQKLAPGESGLLALDWWNGNRSILIDNDLQGMMLGMTLTTKPEEMYRALIEATAFGTRIILDNFEEHGVKVDSIVATGGITQKNPMLMQIYADITRRPYRIAGSEYGPALGAAVMGALAAGKERGGYDNIFDVTSVMANLTDNEYLPDPQAAAVYDRIYGEWKKLHDYFGRGENDVMKHLKTIRLEARAGK